MSSTSYFSVAVANERLYDALMLLNTRSIGFSIGLYSTLKSTFTLNYCAVFITDSCLWNATLSSNSTMRSCYVYGCVLNLYSVSKMNFSKSIASTPPSIICADSTLL